MKASIKTVLTGITFLILTTTSLYAFSRVGPGDFQNAVQNNQVVFEDVSLNGSVVIALSAQDDALRNGQNIPGYPECGSNVDCNVRVVNRILQERADNACRLAKTRRAVNFSLSHQPYRQHITTDGKTIGQVNPQLLQDYKIGNTTVGIVKNFHTLTCLR